jgi:hypothetical protein
MLCDWPFLFVSDKLQFEVAQAASLCASVINTGWQPVLQRGDKL